jgi:hypothetical protein
VISDRRRLALRHIRLGPAPCIRARTRLIGGVDRSLQYAAEVRRLGRLDAFENDVIGVHDVVEAKMPHTLVAPELVHEVGAKRAGPAPGGTA